MRLIDAEALEKEIAKDITGGLNYRWYIQNAPTVDVLVDIKVDLESLDEGISSYHNDRPWIFKDEALAVIDNYIKS